MDKRILYLVISIVLISTFLLIGCSKDINLASEAPFLDPPKNLDTIELSGTWTTNYMEWGTDKIIIRSDGKYKQIYSDKNVNDGNYEYETPWDDWWVESFPDGRKHLHLSGAKYFLEGVAASEKFGGSFLPCTDDNPSCENGLIKVPFLAYDWIGDEFVETQNELILNVRVDSDGNIILVHLWISSDRGFPLIGGESEIFRKEELESQ